MRSHGFRFVVEPVSGSSKSVPSVVRLGPPWRRVPPPRAPTKQLHYVTASTISLRLPTRHEIGYADDDSADTSARTRAGAPQPGASAAYARPATCSGDNNRHVPGADPGNVSDHHRLGARLRQLVAALPGQ